MGQLAPAASALPGYGTSALPWTSEPSLANPYLIKIEPHQDSCDGRAGTQGWGAVVVQGAFSWNGTFDSLIAYVSPRMNALGWEGPPGKITRNDAQTWRKRLTNGKLAVAGLSATQIGQSPAWEFVAQAPPIGKVASGC